MKERFIIIIVAIISGLFITSAGFFIYQSTKKVDTPVSAQRQSNTQTTPSPTNSVYVKVSEPSDESLTAKRTLVVKGLTNPGNTVIVSTNIEDLEVKPTQDGAFSVSIDIDAGANELITRAIAPDGSAATDLRTITYSTDEF